MMSQPNRPLEEEMIIQEAMQRQRLPPIDRNRPNRDDMVFQEAMQRQRQLDIEQPITPDELQLTPSERSASNSAYLLKLGIIALSVLLVLLFLFLVLSLH